MHQHISCRARHPPPAGAPRRPLFKTTHPSRHALVRMYRAETVHRGCLPNGSFHAFGVARPMDGVHECGWVWRWIGCGLGVGCGRGLAAGGDWCRRGIGCWWWIRGAAGLDAETG